MPLETWKPPLPKTNPELSSTFQSLSQWLKVPWTKTYSLTFSGSSSSGSYAQIPNATALMPIRKLRDDTILHVNIAGSFFCPGAPAIMYLTVYIDSGSNYVAGGQYVNTAAEHIPIGGQVDIPNIPAGIRDIRLGWARGLNAITVDANDFYQVTITEINPMPDL